MRYFYLILILSLFYCFTVDNKSQSFPDPDAYLMQVFTCFQKNDTAAYMKMQPTLDDFRYVVQKIEPNQDRPIREEEIIEAHKQHLRKVRRYYKQVQESFLNEKLDWSKIKVINTILDLEKEAPSFIHTLQGGVLFMQDKEEFRIEIDEAALINGRWVGGTIRKLDLPSSRIHKLEPAPGEFEEVEPAVPDTAAYEPKKD